MCWLRLNLVIGSVAVYNRFIIILILCFLTTGLISQNYRNICSPGTTFYKDKDGILKAFRRDSVYYFLSHDTIFFSYRTILPQFNPADCLDTTNGSILGRKVFKKSDGTFRFLNHTNDTIIIKTQAALDETWKFISLPQNSYIEAKVISINSELVLGITDLVKTVSLQAKNSVGNNIVYYLNDQTIKISQHYGLTKMLDIYLLKDTLRRDTTAYFLAGKTTPSIGIQPFSIGDVYNLEVGDIFHYKGCVSFNGNQDHKYEIRRILSKTVSVNRDTLIYQIEDCMVDSLPHPPPNIIRTFDTITVKYFLSSLSWEDIILQKLPMEFYNDNMSASMYTLVLKYNGRPEHSRRTRKWIYNFDSCWSNYNAYSYVIYRYSPGLGQTYHYYRNYDMSALTVITDSLVYFQRGSEAWGIPVSTNCNTLVGVESIFKSAEKVLKVVPNPIGEYAEVIIPGLRSGEQATLELYNNLGQGIMKENITYSPYILRRYNFPPGMYLIMVMSADGRIIGRIKIVFR